MCNSKTHNTRPNRESLSKRLGLKAWGIRVRDGERCIYCNATKDSSGSHLHLDHVDVSIKGTPRGDSPENLVQACIHCNSARQQLALKEWAGIVAKMHGGSAKSVISRVHARLAQKIDMAAAKSLRDAAKSK